MFFEKLLVFCLLIRLVKLEIQINFQLTDWTNENHDFQHHCLNVAAHIIKDSDPRQIISYCMGEWSSNFNLTENNFESKFNFSQLAEQHVTIEQLYHWSASIDLIENYQIYLDQLLSSDEISVSLATEVFYNCTLPYFGWRCQYALINYTANYSSLNEFVYDYYQNNRYEPTELTCYLHLNCKRGPLPACLDWTEICDGIVHCLNDGLDEKFCWQLEIHQCNENEFQCGYGQCIPKSFTRDPSSAPDCLDRMDEHMSASFLLDNTDDQLYTREPIFAREDVSCTRFGKIFSKYRQTLTSSCGPNREYLLGKALFSIKPKDLDDECWSLMKCIMQMPYSLEPTLTNILVPSLEICEYLSNKNLFNQIVKTKCPEMISISDDPFLHGQVYIVYNKAKLKYSSRPLPPTYICYDDQYLPIPNDGKAFLLPTINKTCRFYTDVVNSEVSFWETRWLQLYIKPLTEWLRTNIALISNDSTFCNQSMIYQCRDSLKCISKNRLLNTIMDCYYGDDEDYLTISNNTDLMKQLSHYTKCKGTNEYIHIAQVNDGWSCDCKVPGDNYCSDEEFGENYFKNTILFQTICDKYLHLSQEFVEDKNETDETNCEHWPSLHIYNRCDGFWHFPNGIDEINCDPSIALLNCSENHHVCVSIETKNLICLPIEKANDGIIDCIGAADEPTFCDRTTINESNPYTFYCKYSDRKICILSHRICNDKIDCEIDGEDELVCQSNDLTGKPVTQGICAREFELYGSDIAKSLCRSFIQIGKRSHIYFTLDQSQNSLGPSIEHGFLSLSIDSSETSEVIEPYQPHCHRGFPLQLRLNKELNLTSIICLCPPSFYGDRCQYQNQRISLTVQFHATAYSRQIPFIIIISLIDDSNERLIHSSEQLNYLFLKDCQKKFNFYLLYSTRPKNLQNNYSLHIDIYERRTLTYRASFIKHLNHSFLPVHRLVFQFNIPNSPDEIDNCVTNQCIHGKCIRYFDDSNNESFCQCDSGWTGQYCTIEYSCSCSTKSLCLGQLANNRSLCVCPMNKMGPRCLIDNNRCQEEICMNGGTCIPTDEYETSKNKSTCYCPKGFSGHHCEISRTKFIISFDQTPDLHSLIFAHFIQIQTNNFPVRTTTVKRITMVQNFITIYWSLEFHLLFIELPNKNYHLIYMEKTYQPQMVIEKKLTSRSECLNISEVFNQTILDYHRLHRIKYYHLPCQINLFLTCFYDEQQFCMCQQVMNEQRVSNCFEFDHNTRTTCLGKSDCSNGGDCYQEKSPCPKYFLCQCPVCYYGTKCELTTNAFSLSLDAILAFHIHSNRNIIKQSYIVLISEIFSILIIISGLINGILSLLTFKSGKLREFGCGIYLLFTSVIILLTMIIFTLKFWIFIYSQIGLIQNELFLKFQCIFLDFLLRICLTMDQWLTAFVSIERAIIAVKGINFNQRKIKSFAKYIICFLLFIIMLTCIHDPLHRNLYNDDDDDEKRFQCIAKYRSSIRLLDYVVNTFHFIAPFIINIISTSIIIISKTQQRKSIQKKQKYGIILKEQIQQHKNLLIGPFVLILLVIPRLIIAFASSCIRSASDSHLFLTGYFISLIPSTLTFVLFVLPSTVYKQEFHKAISRYRNLFKIY
ncbi:hypothetical protein I4U23_003933 [Adineta vaga]|nr:hypothetical protein I4U23_003933 [Adineta vaga]